MTKIYLDNHAARTMFILGAALFGGDYLAAAKQLAANDEDDAPAAQSSNTSAEVCDDYSRPQS